MEMGVRQQLILYYSLFCFLITYKLVNCDDIAISKIVITEQGKVEGYLSSNKLFYEYCGIRYAVVKNRFMAPEDPPSIEDVYKADVKAVLCPQFTSYDPLSAPSENEDCLILNIFVPTFLNTTNPAPVMVFLHGGDFGVGSSSPYFYGPQFLISHGVILITVNYRLNAFGFLNLELEKAPGNAGLKDIRAALRWIRNNIKNFGGDNDNVTVFGHGSGGVAAIYLTLSESCKGLFKRIISQSGSPFSPKSFDASPVVTASNVAKSLGVNTLDPKELLDVYQNVQISTLEEAISNQMNAKSVFLPSVEKYLDNDPFLTDTPYNILMSDSFETIPAIFGQNTVEGLVSTLDYNTITSLIDRIKNEDFTCLDQKSLRSSPKDGIEIRELLRQTYFRNISNDESIIGGLINMNSDFGIVGPMSLFLDLYCKTYDKDVYQYIFNYRGNRNLGSILTNTSLPVTTYMDELFYLFDLYRLPLGLDEDDARIISFMTMMWTNFAKFGTPTPDTENGEWLRYPHQLAISLDPQYVAALTPERAYFWRGIYNQYGAEIKRETSTSEP